MKLHTKVNLFSTLLTFIILVASFTGIYFLYEKLAYETEYAQLQDRADELLVAVSHLETTEGIETVFRAYIPSNGLLRVVNNNNNSLITMQATSTVEKIPVILNSPDGYTISHWQGIPVIAMQIPIIWPNNEVAAAQLVQPLPDVANNMELLRWILIVITLMAFIPIYFSSSVLAKLILTPIQRLTSTMQKNISNGSYEQIDIKKQSKDEIAQMTDTYNALMVHLENNYAKQQQFVGNASHELKTPLTVIESYAKLLERRGFENVQVAQEAVHAITKETATMKALIEQMLQLSKANEKLKMDWAEVNILHLLTHIATQMKQAYGTTIIILGNGATIISDEEKLKQLLFIFLDNARKYSDDDICVHVTTTTTVQISIQDKGIGIPKDDLPHLFDRFYRVGEDRNRKTGGTGLGLAIAKQLTESLSAHIDIESAEGVGTTILLTLPKEGGVHD
ncbi:sensor histidine kinase [Solibacillus sp. FSL H8-0538]|uniref:sensor histidine kinase n=1 Tax=Solibacillus sp. FSL H8-0538 TaxID=2921400 RepID=UPI0030F9A9FD